MKKTLLAAALALGFAGVAQAETSVTLYGIVDTGIGYTEYDNDRTGVSADRTGLHDGVNSGNRWGLRGSEDLGNGLRAIFQLESGFYLRDGTHAQDDRLFGREASLGLQSDSWGTLKFGRQTNIASQFLGGVASPFGDAFSEAHIGNTFTSMSTVRADEMVSYVTPSFSGFRLGVGYSFGVNGQSFDYDDAVVNPADDDQKLLSVGLVYANGPLAVGASYDNLDADDWDDDVTSWAVAASYDFEVVKLHLGFGQDRKGRLANQTNVAGVTRGFINYGFIDDDYKTNNYSVGLSAPVGAGNVMLGWQMADLDSDYATPEDKQHLYSLGYTYPFSKRTNLYAVGTYGTGYGFDDVDVKQVIVGLRHRF